MKATISTISTGSSHALTISGNDQVSEPKPNVVQFKVKYPDNFRGTKFWTDGSVIEASPESAANFEARNLGKIVTKSVKEEAPKEDSKEDKAKEDDSKGTDSKEDSKKEDSKEDPKAKSKSSKK